MKTVKNLTIYDLLEVYNANNNSNLGIGQVEIEGKDTADGASLISIHPKKKSNALQLNISSLGSIYLYQMDTGEIQPNVTGALRVLREKQITPFYYNNNSRAPLADFISNR